ncbi:MAG: hypothetical protein ACR2QU_01205 [Gammaproteobacteria bacterium]
MSNAARIFLLAGSLCLASAAGDADTVPGGLLLAQAVPQQEIVFGCEYDTSDEILGHICRRAGSDALRLASNTNLEMQVTEPNSVSSAVWGHGDGFIQVTLQMKATRPSSQFAKKVIACTLDGRRMPEAAARRPGEKPDPAVWSVSFEAEGVPRDLVHPVADAVEQQVATYLSGIAADSR